VIQGDEPTDAAELVITEFAVYERQESACL
jgi:hypothetical protein